MNFKDAVKTKILVTYHKPSQTLEDIDCIVNINGGRALVEEKYKQGKINESDYRWLINNTEGDNTGDNISSLNDTYNELTTIYWAWKNQSKLKYPNYIGFMHYRRHFLFDDWKVNGQRWTFDIPFFGTNYKQMMRLNFNKLDEYLNKFDCLYACAVHKDLTVYEQYCFTHNSLDFDIILDIISHKYPNVLHSAKKYIQGFNNYFCNMFVMKTDLFNKYCDFLFDIISNFVEERNKLDLPQRDDRLFISERVTGIYIQYLIDSQIKCCPLNITFLDYCDIKNSYYPAFDNNNIPIVFSVDRSYLNYLCVTIQSIVDNSDSSHNYDIFVFYTDLSRSEQCRMLKTIDGHGNFSIRLVNILPYCDVFLNHTESTIEHISVATYFRFVIDTVLSNYEKVLYLDSDLIVNKDLAELFYTDLEDCWVGAAISTREYIRTFVSDYVFTKKMWRNYLSDDLNLKDVFSYFQAGVLLISISKFKENNVLNKLVEKKSVIKKPYLMDQDILNSVLQGHVKYFPVSWNVEWQIVFEYPDYKNVLPCKIANMYEKALSDLFIIHYASPLKPWFYPELENASYWWNYARKTDCYEIFLKNLADNVLASKMLNINNVTPSSHVSVKKLAKNVLKNLLTIRKNKEKGYKMAVIFGIKIPLYKYE